MVRFHTLLTVFTYTPLLVLACSTAPGGGGGPAGPAGPGSGGIPSASGGATSSGGTTTGGAPAGGSSSGGMTGSGGKGSGDGGLGGETASGGGEASGGETGDGGSGGTIAVGYAPCDGALGMEDNPDCADGELCVSNACTELCPVNDIDAAQEYECPTSPPGGEAMSRCQTFIGRCILHCALQGGLTYECPDGMDCVGEACGWPD